MAKLKLGLIADEKPVKVTIELTAATYRDLLAYADTLAYQTGQPVEPAQLIAPMVSRFMAADRGFTRARRSGDHPKQEQLQGDHVSEPARGSKSV